MSADRAAIVFSGFSRFIRPSQINGENGRKRSRQATHLTLRSERSERLEGWARTSRLLLILRDAARCAAPQDEGGFVALQHHLLDATAHPAGFDAAPQHLMALG